MPVEHHHAAVARAPLAHQAHVWSATTQGLRALGATELFEGWLSDDERERYRRYVSPPRRELFLFGRAVLRHTLSRYADVDPAGWVFVTGAHGRPELDDRHADLGLRFNLSHTPDLIVCLVSDGIDAGVDVEGTDRTADPLRLAGTVCSPRERRDLESLAPDALGARFYEIWTLKEAYIKARGVGMAMPLRKITVVGGGDGPVSMAFEPPIEDDPRHWQFALWRPDEGHQGALALRRGPGSDRALVFRRALAAT